MLISARREYGSIFLNLKRNHSHTYWSEYVVGSKHEPDWRVKKNVTQAGCAAA